jgi:hypothetical protein
MKIASTDKDIRSVLTAGFYTVPRFQRPYSWDKENVFDFWNDIFAADSSDYFIGSMVVFESKDGTIGVVDGQQRLTTITIALATVRNAFVAADMMDLAQGVQTLIEKRDVDNKKRFTLETQTSFPYFQEHIQKLGNADLTVEPGPEEERLKGAFQTLSDFVSAEVKFIVNNPQLDEAKKKTEIASHLSSIRDRLLALKLIFIDVDEENDAYNIFETLNTRGEIHETSYKKWTQQENRIRSALEALNLFGVTQQTPMVLAVVRAYNSKKLKHKHAARVLCAIENFHFAFTQVTSQRSSGGISSMYSSAAQKLTSARDEGERLSLLKEFIEKLIERMPPEDEFLVDFAKILFSTRYSKQRNTVKYILSKFAQDDNEAINDDFSNATIEHILPQSSEEDLDAEDADAIAQLGNLILVPQKFNSKMGEKDFVKKKVMLEKGGFMLDKILRNAAEWNAKAIKTRTLENGRKAYRKLWKIEQI